MKDFKYTPDHYLFAVPSLVIINIETSELHLIDKVSYGFGAMDAGRPVDEALVTAAGFEILGEL